MDITRQPQPRSAARSLPASRPDRLFPRTRLAAVTLAVLAAAGTAHAQAQAQATADWAPGRLLVMPRAGLPAAELERVIGVPGSRSRRLGGSGVHVVELPPQASEVAVLNRLARHPHLKFAELDRRVRSGMAASDPYMGSAWHLPKIAAPTAWDTAQGRGITIAILDSGVLATHADLAANLVPGWNFVDNNANTADVRGHGTQVAGTAAAITNNGTGVAGVAGAARIMPIRVSDSSGYAYYSTIASGVTWAADNGARVANASFAGVYASASVQSAASYLKSKGGLLVVAAGNSNANDGSPVSTTMIPVSATDSNDAKASWSSYGSYVAVAAPGVGIWTTHSDGNYTAVSGTSFAAPATAGVIALMMSVQPTLSPAQVESLLYKTALDLGTAGRDIYFGHGRVDAAAAVAAAAAAVTVDSQAPTVAVASLSNGASVSGLVPVDVTAGDNVGVTRVDLRVNGKTVASDSSAPYQFSWDTSTLANGTASVSAVAVDAAGNSGTSATVSVTVANTTVAPPPPAPADTTAPTVQLLNPASGSKVSGNVAVRASASDDSGSAGLKQQLYIDGKLVASATGGSLSYTWNTRKVKAGSHTLQAVATDAAGNKNAVSVTVSR